MMSENIKKRIEKLRRLIEEHNYRYYVENNPTISDLEYDALYKELEELEERYPRYRSPHSPTQRVGAHPVSELRKIQHPMPMMSISNTYEPGELKDFDRRCRNLSGKDILSYVVEPKIDGVAVTLMYENGTLSYAATRGDGTTGEDVTHTVKTIYSIPSTLKSAPIPSRIEVRGEIYFENEDFEILNEKRQKEGKPLFANPRNAAAGTIKLLDPRIAAERPLKAFLYTFGLVENIDLPSQQVLRLSWLKKNLFPVNPHYKKYNNVQQVVESLSEWEDLMKSLPYNADGIVIKINDISLHPILGSTLKSPRWAVAYKFTQEQAFTTIKDIRLQVGRTGAITPVAELEPVRLGGTTISRASLHNPDEIERKDIRKGDTVILEKGGGIIPRVVSVVKDVRSGNEKPFKLGTGCPECNSPLKINQDEAVPRCENINCPAQLKGRILHFCSRYAMNIEGMGPALLDSLLKEGMIYKVTDLYTLRTSRLQQLERMGEKSADNLLRELERSKDVSLSRLIYALGIRHVGLRSAQILARHFTSLDEVARASEEELLSLPEIGTTMARSIVQFFQISENQELIENLKKYGIKTEKSQSEKSADREENFFTGKNFVLTGAMEEFTRSEAKEIIEQYGGRVTSTVSGNTDYIVLGENPGSKLDKARKYGISILRERDFEKKIRLTQGE